MKTYHNGEYPHGIRRRRRRRSRHAAAPRRNSISSFVDVTGLTALAVVAVVRIGSRGGDDRGGGEQARARVCVCAPRPRTNEPPSPRGRSSRPFNRSPLVNRRPGGKPTVARVGGHGGPPLCVCRRRRRPVHRRDLNVHRSQVAISVDRFWSSASGHHRHNPRPRTTRRSNRIII